MLAVKRRFAPVKRSLTLAVKRRFAPVKRSLMLAVKRRFAPVKGHARGSSYSLTLDPRP